jgi:hypothetical protein
MGKFRQHKGIIESWSQRGRVIRRNTSHIGEKQIADRKIDKCIV